MASILRFTKRASAHQHDMLAHDVALRTSAVLLPRLEPHIKEMPVAELRGYLRVRVLDSLRDECRRAAIEHSLGASQTRQLSDTALERVVHQLIEELQPPPVVSVPAPHVRLRAAA